MDTCPTLHHIFVDYENVQALDCGFIGERRATFTFLIGPNTKKLNVELVESLFAHAASVEFVRLDTSGRNALDFTLAYYIGRGVAADPVGSFHIVSKDKGYDPMIKHLQSRHIQVQRHDDFSTLPFAALSKSKAAANGGAAAPSVPRLKSAADGALMWRALEHLRKHPNNRPKRRKTLMGYLTGLFGKKSTAAEIEKLVGELLEAGYVAIDVRNAVTYIL